LTGATGRPNHDCEQLAADLLKEPRKPDGTTDVDVVVVREGKNLKGRVLGLALGIFGKRALGKELGKTVKVIEARNGAR
jgi:hypothetical protein